MLDTLKFRRQKLGANIKDNSLLILFSGDAPVRSGDQFYEYTPHRNFYYLTNLDRPKMVYVLRKFNGVMEDYLFIETVSEVEEKWTGKRMSKEEATEISGPAHKYTTISDSRAIELPTTLVIASTVAPANFASRAPSNVSAVSPD